MLAAPDKGSPKFHCTLDTENPVNAQMFVVFVDTIFVALKAAVWQPKVLLNVYVKAEAGV